MKRYPLAHGWAPAKAPHMVSAVIRAYIRYVLNKFSGCRAVAPSDLAPLAGVWDVSREGCMKRMSRLGIPLVVVAGLVLTAGVRSAGAQTREARGRVTAV